MRDPISHVNVLTRGDRLHVSWRGGGPETSVFVSDSPDDAGTDVSAPDGPGRFTTRARPHRTFVHLFDTSSGFVVAAERRVAMDGPVNFRDLGGYPTIDGAMTRWGQVFRSDGLHDLSDADQQTLLDLGVTTVFDLRSGAEVEHAPDRLPPGIDHVHLPMSSDVAQQRTMLERIVDGDLPKFDEDDMAAGYLRMLEGFPEYFAEMIRSVATRGPIVVHCTAGKDRTGITAMLLLGLAEVADAHILDDYEVSARYRADASDGTRWFAEQIRAAGYDPDDYHAMWGSPRPAMRKTLQGVHARWGGHTDYIAALGLEEGLTGSARAVLRAE